jgi:two-component system, chemotaxis family, response regulator Rcp1
MVDSSGGVPIDVLLVEDQSADAWLVREVLKQSRIGNRLHTVGGGLEALAYLRREAPYASAPRPDLILLSADLADGEALDVLAALGTGATDYGVSVIVMSEADLDLTELRRAHRSVKALLIKPFNIRTLINAISDIDGFWLAVVKVPAAAEQARIVDAAGVTAGARSNGVETAVPVPPKR